MANVVEEYWLGVLKRLQAEVDIFNRLINHQGEKGTQNELSFARMVEKLIPQRFGTGSGLLIDASGSYSSQTDIVIYNRADDPAILAQTNQVLFPIENVRACAEIKTSVSSEEIQDASNKLASVKALRSVDGGVPLYSMFGYGAKALPATLAKTLQDLPDAQKPDLVCIVKAGLIAGWSDLLTSNASSERHYTIGLTELHEVEAGNRISGSYVQAPTSWEEPWLERRGNSYPLVKNGKKTLVLEPSRALLLFCDALVNFLQQQDGRRSTLSHYLPNLARELTPVEQP